MKISIVTPTFNSATTVLNNVNSILNQTNQDFEHIIIDNKSTDETLKLITEAYIKRNLKEKLRIISEKDKGIADAFNKGIAAAKGEIIGILNSDDCFYSYNVLERVADAFEDNEKLFVHGNIYFNDPLYGSNIRKPLMCSITEAMPYNHPAMFFRRKVYEEFGNYNTNYLLVMDFELICRLTKSINNFNSKGYYLNGDPLVKMNAGGASWQKELESIKETKQVLMKYNYWNFDAKKNYILRKLRTIIKSWLVVFKLENVITLWRNKKWKN
jgi:glycosyltransferase involved in cell wall biosynthesis